MRQQIGPPRLGAGRMDKVIGEVRPGIDFEQQVAQFHSRQAGCDQVCKGFCAVGPPVGLQGRKRQGAVFDLHRAVFSCQEFLHPGHARFKLGVALFETPAAVAVRSGLAQHFRSAAGPLRRRDEVGIRVGITAALFDPDTAGAQSAAQMPERAELVVAAAETASGLAEVRTPRLADKRQGCVLGDRSPRW